MACTLFAAPSNSVPPESALIRLSLDQSPTFTDDADIAGLKKALEQSVLYYTTVGSMSVSYFGRETRTGAQMAASLSRFADYLARSGPDTDLGQFIRTNFEIYVSVNNSAYQDTAPVVFSGYYEHTFTASLSSDSKFRFPLYARPPDLVDVPLGEFDPGRRGERIVGRVKDRSLTLYHTREEIDSGKVLAGKGLEIAWAKDLLDVYFLQVQGSGWMDMTGTTQTLHIRYAGDNGRPYKSVGKRLIDSGAMSQENFSRDRMVSYLHSLPEKKMRDALYHNPRYIFFEVVSATNLTRGSLSVPLTPGRSIASDPKLFPPGALAWINTTIASAPQNGKSWSSKKLERFVLNQDEGGAIKGPARIDYFLGRGKEAEDISQRLWNPGSIYFLAPK